MNFWEAKLSASSVPGTQGLEMEETSLLEGMGAFLEGVWGRGHSKVHTPAGAMALPSPIPLFDYSRLL